MRRSAVCLAIGYALLPSVSFAQGLDRPIFEQASDGQSANCLAGTEMELCADSDACRRSGPRREVSGSGLGWVHRNWIGDIIP